MNKPIYQSITLLTAVVLFFACSKKGSDTPAPLDCTSVPKTFSADVNPIIQSSCNTFSCHEPASSNGPGPLTNYTQVFNARTAIRQAIASGFMPRNGSLTTAQKNAILCWIDSGAPNN